MKPRILIVDDDEHMCLIATRALESIALCDSARDVPQAVRALQRQTYDVVIVDVTLPGPSGMTLLEQLRRQWPRTAAVMLSGLSDLSVANEALERGALGYVVKPFRVRDLRIQVTAALAGTHRSTNAARAAARARIVDGLARQVGRTARIACLVVDLEHISLLNASYGVEAVDRLCACVERRLRDFDPSIEILGQLGPSTFAASSTLPPPRTAAQTAQALHRALAAPAIVDGQRIPIAARIGIAVAARGDTADSIVNLAEGAMSAARECGQPFVVYDGDLRETARTQQHLLADAATAIHCSQLQVAYQPQYDLEAGRCVGVEALARWHHPTEGDIPAAVFVPLAERMDLIDELGTQVLRKACADTARLRRNSPANELRVSVNTSTAELADGDYPNRVARALGDADLPASALRLEITESLALDESEELDRVLAGIQALGVELSVDDFGTGYSSFSSLTRVPWAEIKLDRMLTEQCRDPRGQEMLRAIIAFGSALDIDVIAEGIETNDHLDALRDLGCRYGQGFLLGRPQPVADISRRLSQTPALERTA